MLWFLKHRHRAACLFFRVFFLLLLLFGRRILSAFLPFGFFDLKYPQRLVFSFLIAIVFPANIMMPLLGSLTQQTLNLSTTLAQLSFSLLLSTENALDRGSHLTILDMKDTGAVALASMNTTPTLYTGSPNW